MINLFLLFAIASPAYSASISCEFVNKSWGIDFTIYTCEAFAVQNPEVDEVTEILGDHLTGLSNDDVVAFSEIDYRLFSKVPRDLERFFPNLVALRLQWTGLTTLSSEELAPWPNLEYLDVSINDIEELDADLFQYSPKLRWISFEGNSILKVGIGLLSSLNELTYINFLNNPCINVQAYTPELIENLQQQLLTQCQSVDTTEESPNTVTVASTVLDTTEETTDGMTEVTSTTVTVSSTTNESLQCRGSMKVVIMVLLLLVVIRSK